MDHVITFTARERAELLTLDADPTPLGADEVTGPTLVSLVSPGTELNSHYLGTAFPCHPGYAAVFRVDAVGGNVTDLAAGDVVLTSGPAGIGGHRSRQRCPRIAAVPVPGGLTPEVAAHARLMGVSMATLTVTEARPPEQVLVLGLGPVGNLAAQLFQACGYEVSAVDPVEARVDLVRRLGVARAWTALPETRGAGFDDIALAVECSGHELGVLQACRSVRKYGEVSVVGVPWRKRAELDAHDLLHAVYRGYVRLISGWEWQVPRHGAEFRHGNIFRNFAGALRWLAEGRVRTDGLYATARPADCQAVYQDLLHGRSPAPAMVFDWRD